MKLALFEEKKICVSCHKKKPVKELQYVEFVGGFLCNECAKKPSLWD